MPALWEFHKRQRKMPLTTSIFQNVLQASGFSESQRLIREAIQNSVDAHRQGSDIPVSVRVKKRALVGAEKKALVAALDLGGEPTEREELFGLPKGNALQMADDPDVPLPVLIISDYNTHGLTGKWDGTGSEDHFGRLVVNLGIDDKADSTEITGGSFGFGKTVYGKSSRVGIVAFYSVFEPTEATQGTHARFMATGFFSQHAHEDEEYDGFAFFGQPDPEYSDEAIPFVDEEAHKLASKCGLECRDEGDLGTTILVVDCDLDMQELKTAAEVYWWPRLIRQELDLVLIDESKEVVPRPKANSDVRPFIECFQNYRSDYQDPPVTSLKRFNNMKVEGEYKGIGCISCKLLDTDSRHANTVALTRGPGMVVEYMNAGSDSFEPCVGVFVADSDIEKYLTYSEPQMHDTWDPQSDRLHKKHPEDGRKVVASVRRRVEQSFKDFQKNQEPPVPPGGPQPKELANLLGRFISMPGKRPPDGPEKPQRPISLHVQENRVPGNGVVWDEAAIELALKNDYEDESVTCSLTAHHEVLGDASHRILGRTECELLNEHGEVLAKGAPATAKLTLDKGAKVILKARAVTEEDSLARVRVAVEEIAVEESRDD